MNYIYNDFYINDNHTNFVNLLEISGYFRDVNTLNRIIKYIDSRNGKTYSYNADVNLENIETNFDNQKAVIEWLIISSQIALSTRRKNQERWNNNIIWINENNISVVYDNLKHLAFTKEIDFSKKTYKDVVVLGANYITMEKRLVYLISKLDKIKTNMITFVTANDRFVIFDEILQKCSNKNCLERIFTEIDDNSEQKIFYKYFKKTNKIKYFFIFTKKFKEIIADNTVTEKVMTNVLIYNYKSKMNKINSRILGSYARKDSGRNRANTGDTIIALLQEDNISDINELDRYVFVSGQPHIETQKIASIIAVLEYFNRSTVPDGFSMEFVGYGDELQKTKLSIKSHMQTFAGTLFMKYILLLSEKTNDLIGSRNYITKNLSYEAVHGLVTDDKD